jgi:hypothetical protein
LDAFTPDATGAFFVTDFRFAEGAAYVPPIVHGVVTNSWPSTDDAEMMHGYKAARMDWEKIPTASRNHAEDMNGQIKRLVVMSILAFSVLWAGAFFLGKVVRSRSGKGGFAASQTTTKKG